MYRPDIPRSGVGYDVHRFSNGRPLVLGGVEIPFDRGLLGHSDADVVLHAISDALLGAAALGDIGQHFPPDDPRWKDLNSREIVKQAVAMLDDLEMEPIHVDVMLVAEVPRISPYTDAMRQSIAECLDVPVNAVSVKATTNERMGFVGREEGIGAISIATIAAKR